MARKQSRKKTLVRQGKQDKSCCEKSKTEPGCIRFGEIIFMDSADCPGHDDRWPILCLLRWVRSHGSTVCADEGLTFYMLHC